MRSALEIERQPEASPAEAAEARPSAAAKAALLPVRGRSRWDRVRVVCAWCEQTIARAERRQRRPVSHGLCPPCAKRLEARSAARS